MAYIFYNPNPEKKLIEDCTVRAISKLTGQDWETSYIGIVSQGLKDHDMPHSNAVWSKYLYLNGYLRGALPDLCPLCYTVRDFCTDHPYGKFLLATGTHVIAVENGDYYDTWDSGDEVVTHYWFRKES